ncbi:unnamed protein product [Arabidopsis halleri]
MSSFGTITRRLRISQPTGFFLNLLKGEPREDQFKYS